jgi:hypothetical protein
MVEIGIDPGELRLHLVVDPPHPGAGVHPRPDVSVKERGTGHKPGKEARPHQLDPVAPLRQTRTERMRNALPGETTILRRCAAKTRLPLDLHVVVHRAGLLHLPSEQQLPRDLDQGQGRDLPPSPLREGERRMRKADRLLQHPSGGEGQVRLRLFLLLFPLRKRSRRTKRPSPRRAGVSRRKRRLGSWKHR